MYVFILINLHCTTDPDQFYLLLRPLKNQYESVQTAIGKHI